jgi:hypothetical protein
VSFATITFVFLLNECLLLLLLLLLFISLSTQSGNFWIHPRMKTIFSLLLLTFVKAFQNKISLNLTFNMNIPVTNLLRCNCAT